MAVLTLYDMGNDEVCCRVGDKPENMTDLVSRSITVNVAEEVFNTIMFGDLEESKKAMRETYKSHAR